MIAPHLQPLAEAFVQLSPQSLPALAQWYAVDVHFKDPFHDVCGVDAVQRIFAHMFDALDAPRFEVHEAFGDAHQAFLTWTLRFERAGRCMQIRGGTHLVFDPQGRIQVHRDYWDAAEELYAKLPLLGGLMRWLARRLQAPVRNGR